MFKNWLFVIITEYYKMLSGSPAFRVAYMLGQFVVVCAFFGALYVLLWLGWACGLPM